MHRRLRSAAVPKDLRDIEIKRLRVVIAERDAIIADRDAKIERLARDLDTLRTQVDLLLRGRKGGLTVPEGQGLLFGDPSTTDGEDVDSSEGEAVDDESEEPPPSSKTPPKKGAARGRKIDTAGLKREPRFHDLPEAERACPVTGLPMVQIDVKITEEIDYRRSSLVIIEHHQAIYGLSPEDAAERQAEPVAAAMPGRPLPNCIASATLLAWLLVQKYANHLPLYRQTNIFGRDGLRLPRQTLCDWALGAAEALEPIVDHMLEQVRAGPVLQIDDTPVKCQAGRGESNFQARLWAFINPISPGVVYRFTPGRASDTLAIELGNFVGTLVGDGYSGNHAAARLAVKQRRAVDETDEDVDGIALAGCWAHMARMFRDAEVEAAAAARLFRDDIRKIYDIEAEAAAAQLDEESLRAEITLELRTKRSREIVIRILRRTSRMKCDFDEAGLLGKAMNYLRRQRSTLITFLRDGRVPVDNNACERAIRPIAVGRRNWLFAGSMRGGRAAAVAYTLIESCKQLGIDPIDYIADALRRVGAQPIEELEELVPANWEPRAEAADEKPLHAPVTA